MFVRVSETSLDVTIQNYDASTTENYPLGSPNLGQWDQLTIELYRAAPGDRPTTRVTRGPGATVVVNQTAAIAVGALLNYRVGIAYAPPGSSRGTVWIDDVRAEL